jgi:formylglycine-generating enzyme required for sulfatase activity
MGTMEFTTRRSEIGCFASDGKEAELVSMGLEMVCAMICRCIRMATLLVAIFFGERLCGQYREVGNSLKMSFILVPAGQFQMGSPPSEKDSKPDENSRQVTITKPFYVGKTEVTQSVFRQVMGFNPSRYQGDYVAERDPGTGRVSREIDTNDWPVDSVSWDHAMEFCKRLSQRPEEMRAGRTYRLPTEAEWEYACRAGTTTRFSFGDSDKGLLGSGWFAANSGDRNIFSELATVQRRSEVMEKLSRNRCRPREVGGKAANPWGIHDMHGNVWEYCSDWYGPYDPGPAVDPKGPPRGDEIVVRGGGWAGLAGDCRSAARDRCEPDKGEHGNGFRVVMTVR